MRSTDRTKIHILYKTRDEPWGGGNQFLRALRKYLESKDAYAKDRQEADVVLVNSKDNLGEARTLGQVSVHRIDGMFSLTRKDGKKTDADVYDFAMNHADGVIFQSEWSRDEHKKNGLKINCDETVIHNCAELDISEDFCHPKTTEKTRLITTTWSTNPQKGFALYEYLDQNLDFDKYEYVFVGRSPIKFKNIQIVGARTTLGVFYELTSADIFINAEENGTCSNSLIEALKCKLPAVGLNSGSTPEIIKRGGELFNDKSDVIEKIEMVANNLQEYKKRIKVSSIETACGAYYDFMTRTYNRRRGSDGH